MKNKIHILLLISILNILLLTACEGISQKQYFLKPDSYKNTSKIKDNDETIKIATFSDAENGNLGQIIVLALEDAGFTIEDKSQTIGSSTLLRETYQQKLADITIEYTGNAMFQMENEGNSVWQDYEKGYETAREFFKYKYNIDMLHPVSAKNSELLVVTKEFSDENEIKDMWDFSSYVNNGGDIVLSAYEYWTKCEQGLTAFEKVYGFSIPTNNIITKDISLNDLVDGKNGLNCAIVFTTEGKIEELGLVIIDDPESVSPIFSPAPMIDSRTLEKHPEIEEILTPIFKSLETEDLIQMNYKHQSQGMTCKEIAQEYLLEKGFIQ